jgi:nucleotide-binding universal stress UspA family protein
VASGRVTKVPSTKPEGPCPPTAVRGQAESMGNIDTSKCGPVVVGVNGSPNSIVALHRATDTARRLGADLDIVLVVAPQASDPLVAAERDRLDRLVCREFPDGTGVPSRCQVERGDPAVVLLRASFGARLLVLGTREHSAAVGVFGSTTVSSCIDNARCAVEICADQHASAA